MTYDYEEYIGAVRNIRKQQTNKLHTYLTNNGLNAEATKKLIDALSNIHYSRYSNSKSTITERLIDKMGL